MSDSPNTIWVKGYTADGFQVSITLAVDPANLAQWIADAMNAIRAGGIHPREQGTEPGEDVHTLAYVVRRVQANADKSETPIIDLYNDNDAFNFRVLGIYLNNNDAVLAFEQATGLTLDSIPLFDSETPLKRDASKFPQFAVPVNSKLRFAIKKNPKWDDNKTFAENGCPRHLFSRWLNTGAGAPAPAPAPVTESRTDQLLREIDEERSPHLNPDNPVLTDRQFIATSIKKKAKGGKEWYVLLSEDGTFATTWGLSEYGVFSEEEHLLFDDYEEHEIGRVVVTWKPNKDFKNVTALTVLSRQRDPFQDIPF